MFDDKIVKGSEITEQGTFKADGGVFYIMIVPKTEQSPVVGIFQVKLSRNEALSDYPFSVGAWNPVVLNEINVKQEDLANFRIFWGA